MRDTRLILVNAVDARADGVMRERRPPQARNCTAPCRFSFLETSSGNAVGGEIRCAVQDKRQNAPGVSEGDSAYAEGSSIVGCDSLPISEVVLQDGLEPQSKDVRVGVRAARVREILEIGLNDDVWAEPSLVE